MSISKVDVDTFRAAALRCQWINFVNEYPSLPPIFTTKSFSDAVSEKVLNAFGKPGDKATPDKTVNSLAPAQYRTMRFDGKTRFMEMPHPVPYCFLIDFLSCYWDEISQHVSRDESRIGLKKYPNDDRIVVFGSKYNQDEIPDFQLEPLTPALSIAYGNGNLLRLDISNFFPSIYTHALDWAFTGRREKQGNGIGSNLDLRYQLTRTNRTDGISIGPVTSNIAAELILNELDHVMREKAANGDLMYSRAIDDMSILIPRGGDEEEICSEVGFFLSKVGLSLNHAKTKLVPLKTALLQHPSIILGDLQQYLDGGLGGKRLSRAFGMLYQAADANPSSSLVKYGWKLIRSRVDREISMNRWSHVGRFIARSWEMSSYYPHMIPSVVAETILRSQILAHKVPETFVLGLLKQELPKRTTDNITWLLFYCFWAEIDPDQVFQECGLYEKSAWELRMNWLDSFVAIAILQLNNPISTERIVGVFSEDSDRLVQEDARVELWSQFWPIRFALYSRGLLNHQDLAKCETKLFPILKKCGASLEEQTLAGAVTALREMRFGKTADTLF